MPFRTLMFLAAPLVIAAGFFSGAAVSQTSENPAAVPATGPSSKSDVTEITMTDDDMFKPDVVTIRAGATVRWKNASNDEHTVTNDPHVASNAKDVSSPAGAKPFNSGKIKPGGTFEQKFTVPGTYQYVCKPHEDMDMKGKVIVK